MKRIALALFALLSCIGTVAASDQLDTFVWLYSTSTTTSERFALIRTIAEERIPDAGDLYQQALHDLMLIYPNIKENTEREQAQEFIRLLAGLIGDTKQSAAADDLWKAAQIVENPLVRAETIIALGRIRSPQYIEGVTQMLANLNVAIPADKESGEKIAFGTILALEKYRSPDSYATVFFAANGWYNKRVKDQAAATLPILVDDPSVQLIAIMRSNNLDIKLLALQRSEESNARTESKAKVALAALTEGWTVPASNQQERQQLALLRKKAMGILLKRGVPAEALRYLERSYKDGVDMEEKLTAIQAMSATRSDEAAASLGTFLMAYNVKRRDGSITADDERIVRTLIPAIGAIGSAKGRSALQATIYTNSWTPAIQALAAEALKNIR